MLAARTGYNRERQRLNEARGAFEMRVSQHARWVRGLTMAKMVA